jgi:hypothetical protein
LAAGLEAVAPLDFEVTSPRTVSPKSSTRSTVMSKESQGPRITYGRLLPGNEAEARVLMDAYLDGYGG